MLANNLEREICIRAYKSRDARFDGRFFIGVRTTGIFCRPVCPAPSPRSANVEFYLSAAAASDAGFRPCLRCRPEASPGTPDWEGSSANVSRALRLIHEGALDDGSVEELAAKLGIGARQLSRLFNKYLGASPVSVAQTRRLLFAKKLIDESNMSMADIAFSSGFGSIRRFNTVFSRTYGRPPGSLRKRQTRSDISLHLSYRPPYDWDGMLQFFSMRAVPGIESIIDGVYYRSLAIEGKPVMLALQNQPKEKALKMTLLQGDTRHLMKLAERARRVFDLGADPQAISVHLNQDPLLNQLITEYPGTRLPGSWDLFEVIVRAILGQQVSVAAARTLAGRVVKQCGTAAGQFPDGSDAYLFPTASQIAQCDLQNLGLTSKRLQTLQNTARKITEGEIDLADMITPEQLSECLEALPGIGPWTSQYIAMRGLSEPDAFPASDLGLLKATGLNARQLAQQAENWRPWRGYAAIYLWRGLSND